MSCPTCGHTMALLSLEPRTFWCSRCGSILQSDGEGEKSQAPKLVERCREFEKMLTVAGMMTPVQPWQTLGVAESIHPPERPEHTEEELKGGME